MEARRTHRRKGARRRMSRRKRKQLLYLRMFIIIVAIIWVIGAFFVWKKYGPSKETYDMNAYFGIESEEQMGVTINNEVIGNSGMQVDGQVYVSYETVRDYLNSRFYWDPNENILLYTLPEAMIRVDVGSNEYTIAKEVKSAEYVILKTNGSTAYIALDFVQQHTNLEYRIYSDPNRIMIVSDYGEIPTVQAKSSTQVRLKAGVKSPILSEIAKGDQMTVVDNEVDGWKKVRTEDGIVGYVKQTRLRKEKTETISRAFTEDEFKNISSKKTINLAWHQVTSEVANDSVLQTIANTKGLTTISPTWFSVKDNDGNISTIASATYVNYAHQSGIDVWGLVDNFNENVDQYELLSHTSARENLVNQLISEALRTGLDGINVDFEQVPESAGEHYIQFIRELSVKCRINQLVLSVDNYVPMSYNAHYDLKEQGTVADYVIIMGYDEHYSGSYEAGSVASYDYVKNGIENAQKSVSPEKLINAVPFYTRLWKEVPKTDAELEQQAGTEAASYPTKVTSEAMGMEEAQTRIQNVGAETVWDEETQQYYAEWTGSDGATYKIWLEEEKSLEAKLQLMKQYKLAGTAAWKLGLETSDIWELILKYVN